VDNEFVFTNIRLPEELHRRLKVLAARKGLSLAEVMRRAGERYVRLMEQSPELVTETPVAYEVPRPSEGPERQEIEYLITELRRGSWQFVQHRHQNPEQLRNDLRAQREEFRSNQAVSDGERATLSDEIIHSRQVERQ